MKLLYLHNKIIQAKFSAYLVFHVESEIQVLHPEYGIHTVCLYITSNDFEDNPTGVLLPYNSDRYFHCTMSEKSILTLTFPQYTSR